MKQILLTQGQVALVDDEDYEELSKHKWQACWYSHTKSFYAQHSSMGDNGKGKTIAMSRVIMNAQPGQEVDHLNHNTLDNQRGNLRICTNSQNSYNQRPRIGKKSQFKGVCWHKGSQKWQVLIRLNGRRYFIGQFNNELDAAHAYDTAAHKMFGEFAFLNFGATP